MHALFIINRGATTAVTIVPIQAKVTHLQHSNEWVAIDGLDDLRQFRQAIRPAFMTAQTSLPDVHSRYKIPWVRDIAFSQDDKEDLAQNRSRVPITGEAQEMPVLSHRTDRSYQAGTCSLLEKDPQREPLKSEPDVQV